MTRPIRYIKKIPLWTRIKLIILKYMWEKNGKPTLLFTGFHCGICNKWIPKIFYIPTYQNCDDWWGTWAICEKCAVGRSPEQWAIPLNTKIDIY